MFLRVTDGATTITLHNDGGSVSSGLIGARYFPIAGDGATATETIRVAYSGASSDILTTIREVKRLLSDAKIRQTETGNNRVYLEYQINASDSVYRSEIINGRDDWGDSKGLRQIYNTVGAGETAFIIERLDYWEGPNTTLTNATIRNGNVSPYNALSLSAIPGSLPTPLAITVENGSGATLDARDFYFNVDAHAGLTGNQHLLIPSVPTANWTGSITHNSILWALPMSTTVSSKLAGKSINLIAAFSSIPTGCYIRAGLYTLFGGVYAPLNMASEIYSPGGKTIFDLGTLEIPNSAGGGLVVVISLYAPSTNSATLSFAQIAPSLNAMRLITAYTWAVGEKYTHDPVVDSAFFTSGGVNQMIVRRSGGPLLAYPGRTNRLHMLLAEYPSFSPNRQSIVSVSCRPRRQTI